MAGANEIFNNLFDTFQATEFFQDAIYPFSWTESVSGGINRDTGAQVITDTIYSSDAFLLNPSKSERPSQSIFKDIQAGDVVAMVQTNELIKKPPIDTTVTFNGEDHVCKEIVSDPVGVSWKFLLRR
jgi:hypothetical protein